MLWPCGICGELAHRREGKGDEWVGACARPRHAFGCGSPSRAARFGAADQARRARDFRRRARPSEAPHDLDRGDLVRFLSDEDDPDVWARGVSDQACPVARGASAGEWGPTDTDRRTRVTWTKGDRNWAEPEENRPMTSLEGLIFCFNFVFHSPFFLSLFIICKFLKPQF